MAYGAEKRLEIVDYDVAWPARFADLAARLATVLGQRALRIDHIGIDVGPGP